MAHRVETLAVVAAWMLFLASDARAGDPPPILGGTAATAGEYPSVVVIEIGTALCSGTLIAPSWVLTAGHCVSASKLGLGSQADVTASTAVHFGTIDIGSSAGMVVGAADTIPDPMFDADAPFSQHDSGLIQLTAPVTTFAPSSISFVAANAPVGITVTSVGFGLTSIVGSGGVEYSVPQTSMSCVPTDGADNDLLCFSQTDGTGTCSGDSGGPAFSMLDGSAVEVGVTSFGDPRCTEIGVDTRVDFETPFILSHVPELDCATAPCASGQACFEHGCIAVAGTRGVGAGCTGAGDCDTGRCAAGPDGMMCTLACTADDDTTCPAGFSCDGSGSDAACFVASGGGGCDSGGGGASTGAFVLGVALCARGVRRRRGVVTRSIAV